MFAKSQSDNLSRTNAALMETPLFSDLYQKNRELEEQVHMLKCNISYFESTNRKLLKKVDKLKVELKSCKKEKKEKKNGLRKEGPAIKMTIEEEFVPRQLEKEFDETFEEDVETSEEEVVVVEEGEEETSAGSDSCEATKEVEVEEEVVEGEGEEETSAGSDSCEATKEEEVVEGEGEEETSAGSDSCEATKEEEEEEVEVEEEETSAGSDSCEATEEEEVEGEEETSAGSDSCEATKEEEEEEVEVEGEEATEEGEEDVYEIEINGTTYYVSNEQNSVIYAADENGDITIEAGVYKNGKPVFN